MFPDVQIMNNYINGGRGGAGGEGHWNGTGGVGGDGMGPSVNFDIRPGGNFIMNHMQQDRGIDILHRAVALEAIHDSAESFPQPKCHPETRMKILEDLYNWALDMNAPHKILWLYGPAGAGKSAIMQNLARQLQDPKRLGGSFFFKRGHPTRGNGKTLFATIAYQLAVNVPWLRTPISQIVENDPSVVRRAFETQMHNLIFEPCLSHENFDHVTILIDGLDECDGHDAQQEILRVIRIAFSQRPIPFRFIIASRPELYIREVFESPVYVDIHRPFNVEQSFDDVRRYLCDEFARIHREHSTMAQIPIPWPSPEIVEKLVWKSSGYFIYASTIIKFTDDKSYRPTQRLALVLDENGTGSESPFDALDQLYMTILSSAPRQFEFIPILCILAKEDGQAISVIDELLGFEMGETRLLLRGLHSVIKIYEGHSRHRRAEKGRIASYHASFLDFLNSATRSQKFHVGNLQNKMHLAQCFLNSAAGHYRETFGFPTRSQQIVNRELIPLNVSLPPSVELCPLIERMNPEQIFNLEPNLQCMLSWLKKTPSAPRSLIELWEDYMFMSSFRKTYGTAQVETHVQISLESEHAVSPNHKSLQVAVAMVFLDIPFYRVPIHTGIAWDELRAIVCSVRPISSGYDQGPLMKVLLQLFPREAYSWASRDLARRFIPRMRKNPLSEPRMLPDKVDVWERF
ncbi:hypothetical protein C8R45DRAFT_172760 [Mycena sanguinolenta]|nr:hypothetical protein C8R45DRAFT_172760 [Mycena sanguinolenta]